MKRISWKAKLTSIVLLVFSACLILTGLVSAEGAGDGSGDGKNVPFGLVSSEPADGQQDVSLTGDILLHFNKNVIYLLIRENNQKCFSLSTKDGSQVPIEVIMADDQTPEGFEKRRDIGIRPLQPLKPGTAYVLKVSPELQAKNGMNLGSEAQVNFVTAGAAAKPAQADVADQPKAAGNTAAIADKPENIAANTDSKLPTGDKVDRTMDKAAELDNKTATTGKKENRILNGPAVTRANPASQVSRPEPRNPIKFALAAAVVFAVAAAYVYLKKKNQQ